MFTVGFEKISRSEAKALTEDNGGKVLGTISKKLDITRDVAIAALIKAQEKGIDPLKWQKYITMLNTFVRIIIKAEYEPEVKREKNK